MQTIDIAAKLSQIDDYWSPHVVAELNGQHVKLAKFKDEFVWHHHDDEDEMFLVVKGSFEMHYSDRVEQVGQGQFVVVPRGVEHKPVAPEEVHVLLFEPATTLNTGNVRNERTIDAPRRL